MRATNDVPSFERMSKRLLLDRGRAGDFYGLEILYQPGGEMQLLES
jgi:hypothetical protein